MVSSDAFRSKLEEKISQEMGEKLLKSRVFRHLFKKVFFWQADFQLKATEEMTNFALDITAKSLKEGKPTAWTSAFFPDEIAYAAGMTPFSPEIAAGVMAAFGQAEEMLKEAESDGFSPETCSFHRCAGGMDINDYLPEPAMVLASTHLCDGAPQLLKILASRHGVDFNVLDIPADRSQKAEEYLTRQIEEVFSSCERITGRRISQDDIEKSFAASNRAREKWLEACELRKKFPPVLTSPAALSFVYLNFLGYGNPRTADIFSLLVDELKKKLENMFDLNHPGRASGNKENPYLLWLHLRPYFSRELFEYIQGRAEIVYEEMNHLSWPPLDPDEPFRSLARKILSHPGLGPIDNRVEAIEEMIEDYQIDGVVHFSHWGCRQSAGGTYQLKDSLKDMGVPFLDLQGDCVDPGGFSTGQIRTRMESFLEMLESRYQAVN